MAKLENITVMTQTKYVLVLIPFATYTKVGVLSCLTIFGIPVYSRVGERRRICGVFCNAS